MVPWENVPCRSQRTQPADTFSLRRYNLLDVLSRVPLRKYEVSVGDDLHENAARERRRQSTYLETIEWKPSVLVQLQVGHSTLDIVRYVGAVKHLAHQIL